MVECGIRANKLDLEELSEHLLGKKGYYAALLFMFIFAYGAQVAYLVVIADTVPLVVGLFNSGSFFAVRNNVIGITATLVILPLCLLRDLSSLSFTSMISIIADIVLVMIVVINAPTISHDEGIKHNTISIISSSLFAGVGTMSFAFVCQHNSFLVFRTLKERTIDNWRKVAQGSITFAVVLSLILGIAGYLSFLEETKGDILNNFPDYGTVNFVMNVYILAVIQLV